MKAVICTKYGPPEVLEMGEVEKPVPNDDEILIKIAATAVNSGDTRVRGLAVEGFTKIIMRLALGWGKPRKPILGTVYAGVVESTGKKVTCLTSRLTRPSKRQPRSYSGDSRHFIFLGKQESKGKKKKAF